MTCIFYRTKIVLLAALTILLLRTHAAEADLGNCGQPLTMGPSATASDCLFLLRAAVGTDTCATPCICDVDRSGTIAATDALICLQGAVGVPVVTTCVCPLRRVNITIAGSGSAPMAPEETAGGHGVESDNWNNLSGTVDDGANDTLFDGDGVSVDSMSVGYMRTGSGSLNDGGGTDTTHFRSGNIDAHAYPAYDIFVTNVPYTRYDVYAYHEGGAPAGLRRVAQFSIGDEQRFGNRPEHLDYLESTATADSGSQTPFGNYVVFRDMTETSFTMTIGGGSANDGVRRNRFSGFQIVEVGPFE